MATKLDLKSLTKTKKIESPLAKYNSVGQLFCVLCNSQVKNEIYWTGHVNGKAHKENLTQLKLKSSSQQQQQQQGNKGGGTFLSGGVSGGGVKRPASTEDEGVFKEPAPKRMVTTVALSGGGEDKKTGSVGGGENEGKSRNVKIAEEELNSMMVDEEERHNNSVGGGGNKEPHRGGGADEENQEEDAKVSAAPLPEGFFDDPKEDAKARGVKFKDPQDVEWDKFVKEIASEDLKSNELVGIDQEATAVDRELEQIEEQMVQWQRVIQLEKKAEELGKLRPSGSGTSTRNPNQANRIPTSETKRSDDQMEEDEDDEDEDLDFDEELDWRNKKR